jgi:hypothetical protein
MKIAVRLLPLALVGIAALSSTGCQTYMVGQVLPSPYHMKDDVEYHPRGSQFPLYNELNAMQAAEEEAQAGRR